VPRSRAPSRAVDEEGALNNVEIVTVAVYLCGGDAKRIDTEDVAIKASEISPGRFSWKKYKEQVNLELIRVYLSDAKKPAHGAYAIGSGNIGWSLTPAGLLFAKAASRRLSSTKYEQKRPSADPKWLRTERERLLSTDAFRKFRNDMKEQITESDAAVFFRVDDYVRGTMRQQKVTRVLGAFGDHKELGPAVHFLASILNGK
jgi:hypothetical protein